MSYPRVNLIKKNEKRYQGVVSRGFILLAGIGTPVLLIVFFLGMIFIHCFSVKSQLQSSRNLWEVYEPKLTAYRADKQELTATGQIQGLFDGWQESQTSFLDLLDEVQDRVPANIQFTRFSIRSDSEGPVYKTPKELELNYGLVIDGIAIGDAAEGDVIRLQKELLGGKELRSTFDSLKLASMRKGTSQDGQAMRQFRLMGLSNDGEKK